MWQQDSEILDGVDKEDEGDGEADRLIRGKTVVSAPPTDRV